MSRLTYYEDAISRIRAGRPERAERDQYDNYLYHNAPEIRYPNKLKDITMRIRNLRGSVMVKRGEISELQHEIVSNNLGIDALEAAIDGEDDEGRREGLEQRVLAREQEIAEANDLIRFKGREVADLNNLIAAEEERLERTRVKFEAAKGRSIPTMLEYFERNEEYLELKRAKRMREAEEELGRSGAREKRTVRGQREFYSEYRVW